MSTIEIGLFGTGCMLLLVVCGVRIAFAAGVVGLVGLISLRGFTAGAGLSGALAHSESSHYTLSVLPMFILIGFLAFHAGITQSAFYAARVWCGRLPGGLAVATVLAAGAFGAVSGASTASAAVFSRIAIPEMLRYGYAPKLAAASVAAGGTLASLIPPSAILVIYAIIVEQSVGALLLAGFIPGFLSALNYALIVVIWATMNKSLVGPAPEHVSWGQRFRALRDTWGIIAVIGVILGGLYTGWMTPTEVGGVGAFIMLVMAISHGMRFGALKDALRETAILTAMIFTIIWSILIFVRFLGFTGVPSFIAEHITGLEMHRIYILLMILGIYFILGMFMDGIGMLLLTLPVVFPIIVQLGYDPVWFGIIVVKMVEIGLVTPPIGLNCFVVNGVRPDIPLSTVFSGVWPFVVADVAMIGVLIAIPEIVTFLPNLMIR